MVIINEVRILTRALQVMSRVLCDTRFFLEIIYKTFIVHSTE